MAKAGSTFSNFKSPFQRSATWGATGPWKPAAGNPAVQTDQAAGAAQAPAWAPGAAPWDSAYNQSMTNLDLNKTNALGQVAKARTNTSQLYGLNADGTDNTTDPFSKLALLRSDYEKIKRGSSASYAARGLGYDGAYQNKVNANNDANLRSTDALNKDFAAQNTALDNQQGSINSNYLVDQNNLAWNKANSAATFTANNQTPDAPSTTAAAPTRRDQVLAALNGNLGPAVRKRLAAEAKANGWA